MPYFDATSDSFERIVVATCFEILGDGVQPFSTGPDGGRDARFEGTASRFPSENAPLSGKFVVQAKHTENPVGKFSDTDFSGQTDSSVLSKEIPRIRNLVNQGELQNYMLFSNRRLAGVSDSQIRQRILNETGVTRVELFGVERMDVLLKRHPTIATTADVKILNAPLLINPDDLAETITALDRDRDVFSAATEEVDELERVSFRQKNAENGLSEDFAKLITSKYLKDFDKIKRFLALPANDAVLQRYLDAAAELHDQIVAHRADHDTFDKVLVRIQNLLFERDGDLRSKKRLTKLVLYYMYWNCDIGTSDAAAE
ncbi:MAG: ABC-three component system protein [Gemmatimonadaceae bacterium]